MRLSKLILQNIKSFKDRTEIDFSENMNIFIGPNGGGKSNLMNTLSWVLNSRFYRPFNYQFQGNRAVLQLQNFSDSAPEPHWSERDKPSFVWIELVVTREDIEGMREYWRNKDRFRESFKELVFWEGNAHLDKEEIVADFDKGIVDPDSYELEPGRKVRYKISINRDRVHSADLVPVDLDDRLIDGEERKLHDAYLRYLTDAELRKILRKEEAKITLPYILFGPSREPHDLSINMSGGASIRDMSQNYRNEMQNFLVNSKGSSQIVTQIASAVIGAEYVRLIYEKGLDTADEIFSLTDTYKELSKELEVFGFKWGFHVVNKWANAFQIVIARTQEEGYFSVVQASSGERQLLNFIFGLSSAGIENSLVIIDEPELNLHPRWQKLLLRFFLRIQAQHNCQFVLSTHSASFLDESTLPHVRRIYRNNQSSMMSKTHPDGAANPTLIDAVKLLNAQQNERIFFTQKAVLVEGQSDYVIWQKLISRLLEIFGVGEIIEVIEVLGSSNFKKYRAFLELFEIESFVVADQDYVMTIGDQKIKNVFARFFKENKACQNILKSHSLDKMKLISALESAIDSETKDDLLAVLEYLKCRNTSIDFASLSESEMAEFDSFRSAQREDNIFVLKKGALESYYLVADEEQGVIKKDTDKAIAFASNEAEFRKWMCNGARLLSGETPTIKDKIMAEEASEFISIALQIIGIEVTEKSAKIIKSAAC